MTRDDLLSLLLECPLVASVQASPGSPLDDPGILLKLAQASLMHGVKVLRLEGVENIKRIKGETGAPVIGLIKRRYPDTELYITPTLREVEELLETGCEIIALDSRCLAAVDPNGTDPVRSQEYGAMVARCHEGNRLVLADCSSRRGDLEVAQGLGCDFGSTTFGDICPGVETLRQPHFGDLWDFLKVAKVPLLAEGQYQTEAQIRRALQMGVKGVVVGGALNDPVKTTKRFVQAATMPHENVGGVDVGGTWLRFGLFSHDWRLIAKRKTRLPSTHDARMRWIQRQAESFGVSLVGISTGGTVDPFSGLVIESKDTIPDNERAQFTLPGITVRALNDGLASTWGHLVYAVRSHKFASNPGARTVTLAIGTGLGCGVSSGFGLLDGTFYTRVNDIEYRDGRTYEDVLGGRFLTANPTQVQQDEAFGALLRAIDMVIKMLAPKCIFLCGGVALSPWMRKRLAEHKRGKSFPFALSNGQDPDGRQWAAGVVDVELSPFGADAGLYGAAALALWPPIGVFPE